MSLLFSDLYAKLPYYSVLYNIILQSHVMYDVVLSVQFKWPWFGIEQCKPDENKGCTKCLADGNPRAFCTSVGVCGDNCHYSVSCTKCMQSLTLASRFYVDEHGLNGAKNETACFPLFRALDALDPGYGREIPAICHDTGV